MMVYHIPTVFLIIGLLYIVLPIVIWLVLAKQDNRTVRWWCIGGGILGLGMVLVGLRSSLPAWVSYPIANTLAWTGLTLQAWALRRVLDESWNPVWVALSIIAWLCVFEYFRLVLQDSHLRFTWSTMFIMGALAYIGHLAWRISTLYGLRNGRWLSAIYAVAAFTLLLRILRVFLGLTEPEVVVADIDSLLTVFSGLLISVLGSFAFVGVFVERATKREAYAIEQRVRETESGRLGAQIAQLERQRVLGTMSASFAHELSQPLTAILMDVETIKNRLAAKDGNGEDVLESVADIESSTYRTVKLVERIRDFIQPSQNAYEAIDIQTLLKDVAHLLKHEIRKQHIEFEYDLDADAPKILGDRLEISQIVLNVYRNAMQAMAHSEPKKIFVTLESMGARVVLHIRDTGPGVLEALKDKVGQPFVTSKKDGLGVGLSISRAIAEKHGGSLTITNVRGGGAVVELNLPAQ
jgi:signal transduction histidine kinase